MRILLKSLALTSLLTCGLLTGCGSGGGGGSRAATVAPSQSTSATVATFSLTALTPAQGSDQGNVEVTLTGSGFGPGLAITFDGFAATSVVVVTSETAVCRTPGHPIGTVNVSLSQGLSKSAVLPAAFEFTTTRIQRQGVLDTTFAGQGFFTRDERGTGTSASTEYLYGVTTDNQGRILAVGESGLGRPGINRDMVILRFLEDGAPDPSFGLNGRVTHAGAAGGSGAWDKGEAIAVDALGRIVVSGRSYNLGSPGNADLTVWRYLDNGTLDPSFNGQGFLVQDNAAGGNGWDNGQALALDSLGRIVVAGYSSLPLKAGQGIRDRQAAVWRILENGSFDPTFGAQGVRILTSTTSDEAFGVAIDSRGGILVAGEVGNGTAQDVALWRLDDLGNLDAAFGLNGRATHHNAAGGASSDAGYALALDLQDRALVAGRSVVAGGGTAMVVWRFGVMGALDTSFAGRGFALLDDPGGTAGTSETAYGIAVEPVSGSIVVVGNAPGPATVDATIWQLLPDGALDTSFGTQGVFQHDGAAGAQRTDQARALTLDDTGRVIVVGTSWSLAGDTDFAIWRLR
ncbi:MAG: IPT/TIG domain-containing protein [Planctomycetes bacterium]|nr:IPT/TIG domain-containing protein [Planctomycetota bacterium]